MAFQGDSIYWVEVDKIVPNPFQPRLDFDEKKLQELADSIRMYGVLQPLTVTRSEVQREDGTFYTEYEIIAGERRLRASKMAGLAQVPVIIREGEQSEQEKLELAIIENLQREDLNAVDRALAFRQLSEVFGLSHLQVAKKVGRSREYVSNSIRLLNLPSHMLDSLKRGDMMEGHARTLLMLTDRPEEQEVVYKEILLKKLSVREVERIVRKIATDKIRKKTPEFDSKLIELEKKFTETLGTRVQIQKTDFGGKLTIDYFSEDDLAVILQKVSDGSQTTNDISGEDTEKISSHTALEIDAPVVGHFHEAENSAVVSKPDSVMSEFASEFKPETKFQNDETGILEKNDFENEVEEKLAELPANQSQEVLSTPEFAPKEEGVWNSPTPVSNFENGEKRQQQTEPAEQYPFIESNTQSQDTFEPSRFVSLPEEERSSKEEDSQSTHQSEEKTTPEDLDESDLYSIRNFGV